MCGNSDLAPRKGAILFIRRVCRVLRKWKTRKRIEPFVHLSPNSYYGDSFYVDLRNPTNGQVYLRTGEHCVLDGSYIFETQAGEIEIGDRVHIGSSTFISINGIKIDDDVTIAWDCLIYDHNSHSVNWQERKFDTQREYQSYCDGLSLIANKDWSVVKSSPIHICSKVWIGARVIILKGVTIGEGAIVGAGSVVTKDVPPWTVVAGNPAQVVKKVNKC